MAEWDNEGLRQAIESVTDVPARDLCDTEVIFKNLVSEIAKFDTSLDQEHSVGVRLVSFGQTIVFNLEQIGYREPGVIWFKGETENGEPVQLIQHVSQISILLMQMKRANPSQPKPPIGFISESGR